MAFGINLSKTDIIKIFALFVVAAFVFEMLAISRPQGGDAVVAKPGANATGSDLENFQGLATANVTILSWDPALIVLNSNPESDAEITAMKAEGLVAYSTNSSQGLILTLAQKKSFSDVAARIYAKNATAVADAIGSVSGARVQGTDFTRNVQGGTYTFRLAPLFEPGDKFLASFQALVQNGKIVAVGGVDIYPSPAVAAMATPDSVTVSSEYVVAQVPWEMRNNVNSSALSGKLGGANVTVKKRSLIAFDQTATQEKVNALAQNLPAYALAMQQNGISVVGGFVDKKKAEDDFYALGLRAVFPNSTIEVRANKEGGMPNESEISDAVSSIGIANATVSKQYMLDIRLPAKIEAEGMKYSVVMRDLTYPSAVAPMNGSVVGLSFVPYGRAVDTIEKIQLFNPRAEEPENITTIYLNDTITMPKNGTVEVNVTSDTATSPNATDGKVAPPAKVPALNGSGPAVNSSDPNRPQ